MAGSSTSLSPFFGGRGDRPSQAPHCAKSWAVGEGQRHVPALSQKGQRLWLSLIRP